MGTGAAAPSTFHWQAWALARAASMSALPVVALAQRVGPPWAVLGQPLLAAAGFTGQPLAAFTDHRQQSRRQPRSQDLAVHHSCCLLPRQLLPPVRPAPRRL